MENNMKVFKLKDLNLIQQIEKSRSNSYMGFVYILEGDTMVKIGNTNQPYQRLLALKRQAEKIWKHRIRKVCFK